MTNQDGSVREDSDFLPYGEEKVYVDMLANRYKFTGYERDAESGSDYAMFRFYRSNQGRFLSPDPVTGDVLNPQSWNRYAYVGNNPTNFIDPLGLERCSDGTEADVCVTATPLPLGNLCDYIVCTQPGVPGTNLYDVPSAPIIIMQNLPNTVQISGSKTLSQILDCAAEKANALSPAGVFGGKSRLANAFLGNLFSGLNDLRHDFFADNGNFTQDVLLGGASQGLPIGQGPAAKGIVGIVSDAVINSATKPTVIQTLTGATELGEEGLAGPIGWAKLGYDAVTFAYGVAACR
jgi:RHS repeat-associated protein